jgi:hypothetical protein
LRKRDKQIKSVCDLINNLKKDTKGYKGPVWYRGQSDSKWGLLSAFTRSDLKISEQTLIKKFKQNATLLLNPRPNDDFSWLFLMQHYGVRTRLLDWTESPLTATYFAVVDANNKHNVGNDGVLWILLPVELNKHNKIKPKYANEIPSFEDVVLKTYHPESYASETTSVLYPVAAIAPRNNPRMQSQLSVFTISHRDKTSIEEIEDKKHIWRYIIPAQYKAVFKAELSLMGISKFQLFPELSSIGDVLHGE